MGPARTECVFDSRPSTPVLSISLPPGHIKVYNFRETVPRSFKADLLSDCPTTFRMSTGRRSHHTSGFQPSCRPKLCFFLQFLFSPLMQLHCLVSFFQRRHLDRCSRRAARLPDPSQRVRQAALGQAVRAHHQTGQGWNQHAAVSDKTSE